MKYEKNSIHSSFAYLVLLILAAVILYYNLFLGIGAFVLIGIVIGVEEYNRRNYKKTVNDAIEHLTSEMEQLNQGRLYNLPIPMVIAAENGMLRWYNQAFAQMLVEEENEQELFYGGMLTEWLPVEFDKLVKDGETEFEWKDKSYIIQSDRIKEDEKNTVMLQFFDMTHQKEQRALYKENEPVFSYILLDNYDDMIEQLPAQDRSQVLSRIDVKINEWADSIGAFLVAYDSDRYLMIFERKQLSAIEESRFHILDEIREIGTAEKVQLTLSIGIGVSDEYMTIREADELSHTTLDIALARGGDQAVVREDERMTFYGGATEAAEKRTKVKARVKAHGLQELIREADNVLIMGHKTPDMDCLGAAIGIVCACRGLNKPARIVFREINYSIKELFKYLMENGDYQNTFITPREAEGYIHKNTLLIVVDTQNIGYLELPELIEQVEKVVVIDHHRRSGKFIEETVLNYTEAYASSTCELITELLQYFDNKESMTETEANALMAGMCMDTKMFTFKTGVRTFEAASYLRRKGADTIIAKTMLQEDLETYSMRSMAVSNASIYYDNIAISSFENYSEYGKIIAAQAADELLNIKNIAASFVILKTSEGLIISGRSMGDINVQLILEKIGGGGHLAIAGAQLPEITDLEEGKRILMEAIESYMKERE